MGVKRAANNNNKRSKRRSAASATKQSSALRSKKRTNHPVRSQSKRSQVSKSRSKQGASKRDKPNEKTEGPDASWATIGLIGLIGVTCLVGVAIYLSSRGGEDDSGGSEGHARAAVRDSGSGSGDEVAGSGSGTTSNPRYGGLDPMKDCGRRTKDWPDELRLYKHNMSGRLENYIYGGPRLEIAQMPWVVSYNKGCTGFILNEKWFGSAAHCTK